MASAHEKPGKDNGIEPGEKQQSAGVGQDQTPQIVAYTSEKPPLAGKDAEQAPVVYSDWASI